MSKEVLIKKQYKDYERVSRYAPFPYYYNRLDEKYIYGITNHLDIDKGTSFVSHVVKNGDTLDSLSLYYYNNPTYYWIIADFNRIQDPFEPLGEGIRLKIPTFSSVEYQR